MHSMSILKYATSFVLSVSAPFVVPRSAQTTPRYALTILGLVQHNYINSDFTPPFYQRQRRDRRRWQRRLPGEVGFGDVYFGVARHSGLRSLVASLSALRTPSAS